MGGVAVRADGLEIKKATPLMMDADGLCQQQGKYLVPSSRT